MLEIIGLFIAGVLLGRLLKNIKFLGKLSGYVNVTVAMLILVLGISIGSNENVIGELKRVLFTSVVLSVLGIIGSVCGAWFIGKYLINRK
ncbi:MAG: LysO family transporter [Paramuribaculum sp.]|nr:LysO family transporter [Paramuribaculum sp.]